MTHISEQMTSWSLLNPYPVIYYNKEVDEQLVVWNGIHMIPEHAIMLASKMCFNISPTPEMRRIADAKFRKLFHLNAFGHKNDAWIRIIEEKYTTNTLLEFYQYYLSKHIHKIKPNNLAEVFNWFTKLYKENTCNNHTTSF